MITFKGDCLILWNSGSLLDFIGISPSDDRRFPFLCCLCGYIFVPEKNIKSDDYEK